MQNLVAQLSALIETLFEVVQYYAGALIEVLHYRIEYGYQASCWSLMIAQMMAGATHSLQRGETGSTVLASPAAVAVAQSSTCVETRRVDREPRACLKTKYSVLYQLAV